jgi:hypothetical protein
MALDLEIYLIGGIFGTKAAPADTAAFAVVVIVEMAERSG